RIVPAEAPLPGLALSEVGVVQLIYYLLADEHWSCVKIADHLNALGIPPAYRQADRHVDHDTPEGKRKEATAGVWRPSRIRAMVKSTTYKGVHAYGKRSTKVRELITREVPALVDEATWTRALQTLTSYVLFAPGAHCRQYLLRGLVTCGLCGCNYSGAAYGRGNGRQEVYYRCNGLVSYRSALTPRCQSRSVRGAQLEAAVWDEIARFLRDPGDVLAALAAEQDHEEDQLARTQQERLATRTALDTKTTERERMLDAYRKCILTAEDLEQQLTKIRIETSALTERLAALDERARLRTSAATQLHTAEALLTELRTRLDAPPSFEMQRQLVELLVAEIRVDTGVEAKPKTATITVTYRFDGAVQTCMGMGSTR
ncbi:MAG: site-specific recombinase, partial [Chloroflexota bacterium]|nr:site-specific recombinase [Chloroflexota bacterium]